MKKVIILVENGFEDREFMYPFIDFRRLVVQ